MYICKMALPLLGCSFDSSYSPCVEIAWLVNGCIYMHTNTPILP
uniref:Uncharacterized protein n=1 Tax=Anguilla anguilla TaxID=7936 RepID=A0A0E9S7G0_ANGAN